MYTFVIIKIDYGPDGSQLSVRVYRTIFSTLHLSTHIIIIYLVYKDSGNNFFIFNRGFGTEGSESHSSRCVGWASEKYVCELMRKEKVGNNDRERSEDSG